MSRGIYKKGWAVPEYEYDVPLDLKRGDELSRAIVQNVSFCTPGQKAALADLDALRSAIVKDKYYWFDAADARCGVLQDADAKGILLPQRPERGFWTALPMCEHPWKRAFTHEKRKNLEELGRGQPLPCPTR